MSTKGKDMKYASFDSFPFRQKFIFLFSYARPRDFDGMLSTGLRCQYTQRKLQSICGVLT